MIGYLVAAAEALGKGDGRDSLKRPLKRGARSRRILDVCGDVIAEIDAGKHKIGFLRHNIMTSDPDAVGRHPGAGVCPDVF